MLALVSQAALATAATVLFDHRVVGVAETLPDATDLWVRPKELPRVNGFELFRNAAPVDFDAAAVSASIRDNRETTIAIELGAGPGEILFFTSDLTAEYVRLNADYHT